MSRLVLNLKGSLIKQLEMCCSTVSMLMYPPVILTASACVGFVSFFFFSSHPSGAVLQKYKFIHSPFLKQSFLRLLQEDPQKSTEKFTATAI